MVTTRFEVEGARTASWVKGAKMCCLGGARRDAFSGGPGRDILRGGSGNDFLRGDAGFDRMYGNTGKDAFLAHDFHRDRLSGGAGLDRAFLDRLLDTRVGIRNPRIKGRLAGGSAGSCRGP